MLKSNILKNGNLNILKENKYCYNIAIIVKHPIIETWERDLMNFAVTKEMSFNRLELNKKYNLEELGL